jgi:hypothetical protein
MAQRSIVMALVAAMGMTGTVARGQGAATPEAIVISISLQEVRLVLPVGRHDLWRWRNAETPDNQREYGWEVVIDSAEARGFGFYLFKFPGLPPASGSMAQLLRAGQRSVWERTSRHVERVVQQGRIVLSPADSGLAVTITDPWTIDFLFGNRPSTGVMRLQNPGRDLTTIRVSFKYPAQ